MKRKRRRVPGLIIEATRNGVQKVRLGARRESGNRRRGDRDPVARRWRAAATRELNAYFTGGLRSFSIPLDLRGLSPFTRSVLRAAARIPYGEVRSYKWLAQQLGKPGGTRAVGNALGRNPVPIIVPCHRVIRSDGSLGGYALGLSWKRRLLEGEKGHGAP